MKIEKIVVKGFCKYEDKKAWVVEPGLVVVSGRNGAGKSTLYVESIAWALYGDTFREAKADEVINDNSKECYVKLITDVGVIKRVKEEGKGSIVYVDDVRVGDEKIVELVGLSKKMFFNSVAFGNGVSGFLSLNGYDKKQMLTMTFSVIDEIIDKVKYKKAEVDFEKKGIERQIENLKEEISSFKEKLSIYVNIDDKIKKLKSRVIEYKKELEELNRKIDEKLSGVSFDNNYFDEIKKLREKELKLKYEKAGFEAQKKDIISKYENLIKYDKCPTCDRIIDGKYKDNLRKEVKEKTITIDEEIGDINTKLDKIEEKLKKLEKAVSDIERNRSKVMAEVNNLRRIEREKRRELDEINYELSRLENIRAEKIVLEKDIKKKEELFKELENKFRDKIVYLDGCSFWIRKLADYKMMMFDMIVGDFEPIANKFLFTLSNGRFSMKFDVGVKGQKRVSEVYNVKIYDKGKVVDFNRLSNGERRMLTLGVNMCFQYLMTRYFAKDWNIVVFDEVFDGLDRTVRERVVDLLLDFVKETGKCVVVITHDDFSYRAGEWKSVVI